MWFIICFNLSAILIAPTMIFNVGPSGTSILSDYFVLTAAATALAVGGVSVMGWSFKIPAAITVFGAIYAASIAGMNILLFQIIHPWEVAVIISGVLDTLTAIIGVVGILQLAGGPFASME